jgi:hypothetical protein
MSTANISTHPHCCECLLTGWFGCYWPRHPTSPNGYDGQHTTRPSLTSHCSWGGTWVGTTMYAANAPPTPSLTSHCSWGGTWVGRWCPLHRTMRHPPQPHEPLLMGWITGGTTMHAAPGIEQRTTHPQPHEPLLVGWRLEATTAHCYSTHNHCHEPLLVGGKGCYARGGAWQGVFSTGIQWNSWIPGSPIGIGGGV